MEREGRLTDDTGSGRVAHFLAFEVAVESIEEEAVVGDREPVKDFLFLLGADALVFEEEIQERGLYLYR